MSEPDDRLSLRQQREVEMNHPEAAARGSRPTLTTLSENDLLMARQLVDLLLSGKTEGLNFPGVGRLFQRVLAALLARDETPHWQPIETAPKDGSVVLLYGRHEGARIGRYDRISDDWEAIYEGGLLEATHWMPLPAAPEAR